MTPQEHIRHALLVTLYGTRAMKALPASFFTRAVHRETGLPEAQILPELRFLVQSGYVNATPDGLGSTEYYQITPEGILHYERNR